MAAGPTGSPCRALIAKRAAQGGTSERFLPPGTGDRACRRVRHGGGFAVRIGTGSPYRGSRPR